MQDTTIIFCHPYHHFEHTPSWHMEVDAAEALRIENYAICAEQIVNEDFEAALEHLPSRGEVPAIYRGCILSEEIYERLCEELAERGYHLVVQPSAYAFAQYLPNYYGAVEDLTSRSVWTWGTNLDEAWSAAQALGSPPYLVKDHMKSAKEAFADCTWIKAGADRAEFERVCSNLIAQRDTEFARGIVIRKPQKLARLQANAESFPIYDEHRAFFWEGSCVAHAPYFDEDAAPLNTDLVSMVAQRVDSPYFAADFARLEEGGWTLIEINDGGVASAPPTMDPRDLFERLGF